MWVATDGLGVFRLILMSAIALGACATARVASSLAPEDVDYGALRFSANAEDRRTFADLVAQADELEADIAARLSASAPVSQQPDRCTASLIRASRNSPWVRFAEGAPDYESWRRDRAAVLDRVQRVEQVAETYARGDVPADGRAIPSLARLRDALTAAQDERVRELLVRALRDQAFRIVTVGEPASPYTEGLSERARQLWPRLVTARLAEIDCANTAWLRREIAEHGWFDIERFGHEADEAAWLIVQHADRTPAFQGEMLQMLEAMPEGATNASRRAYLWDRVAIKEGRSQRYGTQMRCVDGQPQPIGGLEDGVEQRRAALGMQTFASYQAAMQQLLQCSG